MTKADDTAAKTAIVKALLGKTTGASKGYILPPKPKVQALPTKDGAKAKITWKF